MIIVRKDLILSVIVAFIVGGILGWGGSAALNSTTSGLPIVGIGGGPSSDLNTTLNNLFKEHASLTSSKLTALYKGENTDRLSQLMQDNSSQIAAIVENAYGNDVKDNFIDLWTRHMKEYDNYTLTKRDKNNARMGSARNNLESIANGLGDLFDRAGNSLSSSSVSELIMEHINITLSQVDAIGDGDTAQIANKIKEGRDQAGKLADALSQGITKDKPDMFR